MMANHYRTVHFPSPFLKTVPWLVLEIPLLYLSPKVGVLQGRGGRGEVLKRERSMALREVTLVTDFLSF